MSLLLAPDADLFYPLAWVVEAYHLVIEFLPSIPADDPNQDVITYYQIQEQNSTF